MGETIRNSSTHAEQLGDGREVERGAFADDVDLKDEINARLLREDRITKVAQPKVSSRRGASTEEDDD